MIRAGCKDMEIMKTACVARNTVKSIRSELEESNNNYEKKVQEDHSKSCTKLAEELGVGNTTVRVCINEDLRYHFYKRCKVQILTEKAQENRFNKVLKLLNKLKHPVHNETLWFFSDEKNFTQDQKHNSQNNRCCVRNPHEVPIVAQTKFPAAVIVFGVISSDGPETGLGGICGTHEDVVAPWIKKVAAGRPYVFQQDSAPCRTSRKTQKWLSENLDDYTSPNIWLPNSPDCNPCDFYPWGAVERDTNRTACNTMAELKARITLCFKKLPRDQVRCACSRFQSRLKTVVEVRGAYFE
ncbi:Transposable element tcb2 transposase [Caligus rogercresseyi]|uniref:Transposable element tcb2 transposase n=1 Tax=Caligus rogercresseyi TaxID=217165 RepID=A0A7T8QS32_CALRO|nr:Transposable element tcb2 transposase [Caligus rogercresseyi]